MRVNFRLEQLLTDFGEKKHGLINRIAAHTKLKRHQVSALLKNRVKHLPLDSLGAICQYLIVRHKVSRTQLPAILFALEPEDFWELLCGRQFVEICFGVRPEGKRPAMIVGADSFLHGVLLTHLFEAKPTYAKPDEEYSLIQRMVPAFGGTASEDQAIEEAQALYADFQSRTGRCGLAMLGSIKSNPVIEIPIARLFGGKEFVSEDDVSKPGDRSCPFFMGYRENDTKPPSCHAGSRLAKSKSKTVPGIHYEKANGNWTVIEWTATQDAALVMYTYRPGVEVVEMTIGGFSSRSTHSIANVLRDQTTQLWPPAFDTSELKVGVFVVRFHYEQPPSGNGDEDTAALRTAEPTDVKVIPLSREAIERHLKPTE